MIGVSSRTTEISPCTGAGISKLLPQPGPSPLLCSARATDLARPTQVCIVCSYLHATMAEYVASWPAKPLMFTFRPFTEKIADLWSKHLTI